MIKLTDLLSERERDTFPKFTTKQTSADPDTGTIEWDVIYDLTSKRLEEKIAKLIEEIDEESRSNKFDPIIKELQRVKNMVKQIR